MIIDAMRERPRTVLEPADPDARAALLRESDATLVGRTLAGDVGAFEGIMRRYNPRFYRIARAITGNDADAEDALQEAYVRAYSALASFRGDASIATWMTRILAREAGRVRERRGPIDIEEDERVPSDEASPEAQVEGTEILARVERALDALPEVSRAVFVCRVLEDLDTDETATTLGLSAENVRVRLFRAREALRATLGPEVEACARAWGFDGARCDRIVRRVLGHEALARAR